MASSSLASNNAVRLGAAALVGGLVVYLIWAATSSSSSTPRPPASSSSSSTTTTTTIKATTSTSSKEAEKKKTGATKSSEHEGESEGIRQRQSVDIQRAAPDAPEHRVKQVSTTVTSITEEREEDEMEEQHEKESEQESTQITAVEVIKELKETICERSLEEENEQIEETQKEDAEWIQVSALEEQQQQQEEDQTSVEVEPTPALAHVENGVKEAKEVTRADVKHEDIKQQAKDAIAEQPKHHTPATDTQLLFKSGKGSVQEEFPGQREAAERIEKALAIAEASSPYKNVKISRTISSSSSVSQTSSSAPSSGRVSVSVEHIEDVAASVSPQPNGSSSTRTSQHALNTKAAVFTPSWMPSPAATPSASIDSRSTSSATPQGSPDQRNQWTLEGNLLSQSQSQLQANDRAKMKSRCRFWPNCTNKACKFTHPSLPCRDPENCSFGDRCNFIHPKDLTRRPPRANKANLSRKEPHQSANESMTSSVDSLSLSSSRSAPGNAWSHS